MVISPASDMCFIIKDQDTEVPGVTEAYFFCDRLPRRVHPPNGEHTADVHFPADGVTYHFKMSVSHPSSTKGLQFRIKVRDITCVENNIQYYGGDENLKESSYFFRPNFS